MPPTRSPIIKKGPKAPFKKTWVASDDKSKHPTTTQTPNKESDSPDDKSKHPTTTQSSNKESDYKKGPKVPFSKTWAAPDDNTKPQQGV